MRIVAVPGVVSYDFDLLRRMYFVSSRITEVGRIMCYGNIENLEPRLPSCFNCALQTPRVDLTFRHRASCILGQAFHYSPENAFYIIIIIIIIIIIFI